MVARCNGCGEQYCSLACKNTALEHGHHHCCSALARMATVDPRKYNVYERSTASFLLRAFARRKHESKSGVTTVQGFGIEPSFADVRYQCGDFSPDAESAERRASHDRAIRLARLQKGSLIDEEDARTLLRAEPSNGFHLYDDQEVIRGNLNYPQASLFNHSCMPNCAATATGRALIFEALRDIAVGEELTYCYLRSFAAGRLETLDPWGFECQCSRCDGTASPADVAAFDRTWRCVCGKIVVPNKAGAARALGICCCHSHNCIPSTPSSTAPTACT